MGKDKSEEGGDHSKQKKERGGGNARTQALREEPWRSKAGLRRTAKKEVNGNHCNGSQPGPAPRLSSAFSCFVILLVIAPLLERE